MRIIENVAKLIPLYASYKKYRQRQLDKRHEKLEARLSLQRIAFYKEFLKSNDLVFDVGANVGNRVEAFLKCNTKVIAIEPQPYCTEILSRRFGNKIIIEKVGLADKRGVLQMEISNDSTVSTFSKEFASQTKHRFKYSKWEKTIEVSVTTLDLMIEKYGCPHFCKIDVEGFELEVLKGLTTKIPFISIEYCVPEMEDKVAECVEYLSKLSPKASYNYSVGESMVWALKDWKNYNDFLQHIRSEEFTRTSFGDIYIKSV